MVLLAPMVAARLFLKVMELSMDLVDSMSSLNKNSPCRSDKRAKSADYSQGRLY
jgi:hypothetical protein